MTRFFINGLSLALVLLLPAMPVTGAAQALDAEPQARAAPAFKALDWQGKPHALADYQGKILIVNFWATWCPPCIKEMPSLQRAADQLRADGVRVLGFNMGEMAADIERFVKLNPVDFPLLLDENMAQGPLWGIKGLPTTFIVDGAGNIVYTVLGEREWDAPALLQQIRQLAKPQ